MASSRYSFSGKRTKAQQRRLLNDCINKMVLLMANQHHNHGPLTAADNTKLFNMARQLSSMESKYQ